MRFKRLTNECDCFVEREEPAARVRVSQRERCAIAQLLLKGRQHAAGGPEHITETNGIDTKSGSIERERQQFGRTFGCAQDAVRLNGFIS